jgi:hypothetical protein
MGWSYINIHFEKEIPTKDEILEKLIKKTGLENIYYSETWKNKEMESIEGLSPTFRPFCYSIYLKELKIRVDIMTMDADYLTESILSVLFDLGEKGVEKENRPIWAGKKWEEISAWKKICIK